LYGGLLGGAESADAADAPTSQPKVSGRSQEGPGASPRATEAVKDKLIPLSPQERAWLRDHPVIRVAQDPGWPPIEFVDEQGNPSGMAGDYLRLIEQRLGIKFKWVPTQSWQEAYAKLKRWEIDMTTSVTITPERTKFWAFTKPYMKIPIAVFAQADVTYLAGLRELSGKKVAVVSGYAVNDWIPKDFPKIRLVQVSNAKDGLALLQQGEVFAFIDNMLVVSYYLAKLKMANVKIAGETPYQNAQAMAVRKDWPLLVGMLQKALDSISPKERDEIYQRWLPLRYEHGFNYTLLWQALAVFFVILLGLVVWNRKLVKEIRHRKLAETALGNSEERFRQLFRIAAVPMAFVDKDGVVVDLNDRFVQTFGYTQEDVPTLEAWWQKAYPDPGYRQWVIDNWSTGVQQALKNNIDIQPNEYRVTCKDGTVRTIVISGAVLGDDFLAVFFDITERKLADEELRRTNRALRTLSQCSQILVRAREEKEVLQDFCRIITGDGGYRMAWVGFAEHDEAKSVRPVAQMGFEEGYLAAANITWADTARGKGPTGTAIQTGRTVTALDLLTNPDYTPWRDEATKRGYASSIAIPLKSDGQVLGALNIYASEIDAFNEVEVELLEKVAQTLAYGIIALRAEKNRTQAEEALQRSEDQFRAAFENAPEGMALLDLKRRFLKVNPRLCEMLGYSEQELLGNSFNRFTHPDDRQGGRDRWREFLAGDLSVKRAEKRYIHKNGQVVWVVVSNSAISNSQGEVKYILAHIYDITDRKQAEEKLAQTARQWQTTFDSANDAIWIFDKQQRVLRANKTAEMMFHRSQEEMVGRHCWEIVHGTTEPIPECPLKRAKVSLHRETMELRIGDSWFAVVVDPILDENGQYAGAVHIVSDITERRRLESQLHQSQKMEAVGTLAGGIAHDFNNILAAIMGYTEIGLAEAEEGKSNRAELQGVLQAATRAKKLVQQILTFSRRAEHSLKPIDINEAVVSAGNLLKQTLPRMIEIQMDLSVELPPAMGNPYQIEQILMNLGTNARDAMPDGGTLTIATSQRRVKGVACLACAQPIDGDYVIITVSDTGVGMTEEELARVFEPFYTTKEVGKGTGLGLSAIFGIVGSHGGHITCASEPGKGTTFNIYLPPVAQAGEQPKRAATKSAAGGNETILVVDDEQSILDIAARQLTKSGYKTLTAISGEKALEVYKDRADEIALVILDLSMPGMGGHKCLRELRSLAPELKVIVATGYSRDGDLNKSASSVATALLSKPFSKNELLKTVRKVLDA